jgi:hypothetical protein
MDEIQTAVGQSTGSPATEVPEQNTTDTSPDTTTATEGSATTSATKSAQPKTNYTREELEAEINRVQKKRDAELFRDLGTKNIKDVGKLMRALQQDPDAVFDAYRKARGSTQTHTAAQPQADPRYQQLEQAVYGLSLTQQINDLTGEFPRVKNQDSLVEVLEYAQENQVDLRTAYLHKYHKQDIEDAKKETVASIRQRRHLFLESGEGGITPEDEDAYSNMPEGWTDIADEFIKAGRYKDRKEFAKSYKSKQKKG